MMSRSWMTLTVACALAMALLMVAGPARALTNCTSNGDCPSATPVCNGGVCAECTQGNAGLCTAASRTPICLLQGICGCTSDTQCGAGFVCTTGHYCTAGAGAAGCPPGGYANNNMGQCTKACNPLLNNNCPQPPRNMCSNPLALGSCLECTTTTGCGGKAATPICNASSLGVARTDTCVQCLSDSDCRNKNPHGPLCLAGTPQNSCGCNSDGDCALGKICDTSVHVCVDGCRTSTGARCPPGNQCFAEGCTPVDGGAGEIDAGNDAGEEDAGNEEDSGADGGIRRRDAGPDSGPGGLVDHLDSSLEGGGWTCAMSPAEDALPVGGLFVIGGLAAIFARRTRRRAQ